MLVKGIGYSYNPKKVEFMEAMINAYDSYVKRMGMRPTHVALPKATTAEDRKMAQRGLDLTVASARYGCPLIVVGLLIKESDDGTKQKQGEGQQV